MAGDILPSVAAGELARTRPELPIKLIISDDQLAVIPAAITSRTVDTAFIIHKSPILIALIALFEVEWERAIPVPGPRAAPDAPGAPRAPAGPGSTNGVTPRPVATAGARRDGDPPDPETAALLAMLAAGMTDAAIARSLEWSMRTTQRRMAQLMSELGVTSRFQAGLAVRDRGWL
jgi:hypothetical protein